MAVLGSTFIVTKGCSVCLAVGDINRMVADHEDGKAQSIPCIGLTVEFHVLYIGLCPAEQLSRDHDLINEWLLQTSSCCDHFRVLSKASHALLPCEVVKKSYSAGTPRSSYVRLYYGVDSLEKYILFKQTSVLWRKLIKYFWKRWTVASCLGSHKSLLSLCVMFFLWVILKNKLQRNEELLGHYSNGIHVSHLLIKKKK